MTLAQLCREMSSAEFGLWAEYYGRNGFDADRIEAASANAGAATARAMGAKSIKPADLIPRFQSRGEGTNKMAVKLWLKRQTPERYFGR